MKTKEEILESIRFPHPFKDGRFLTITDGFPKEVALEAMQLYSDKQNKELRETINNVLNKTESDKDVIIIEQGFTLQRLMKELDEVKTNHYQKLDAQLVEDVERLTEENKEKDAEIQRLTKEVEELKLKLSGKTFFNPFEQENTRLRELLRICKEELKEYLPDYLDDLFSNIDNALNHKP